MFFVISGALFSIYILFINNVEKNYWFLTKRGKYKIRLAAILEFSSYILILYAFRMTKVATVVAIRQVSVVFGALLGVIFLKEKYEKVRVFASLIMFIGIYLLVVFK